MYFQSIQITMYFCGTRNLLAMEVQAQEKSKRCSYTKEFKLHIIQWYTNKGQKKVKTPFHYTVDHKSVPKWVQNEELIRARTFTTKKIERQGTPLLSRKSKKSVKRYWFNQRIHQLIRNKCPDSIKELRNFYEFFGRFCCRYKYQCGIKHTQHKKGPAFFFFFSFFFFLP